MRVRLDGLLAVLFPQRTVCHACGAPLVAGEGLLCERCAGSLCVCAFTAGRAETVIDAEIACAASAYRYEGTAAGLVKALKFGSDQSAAIPLAEGMAAVYAGLAPLRGAELCVAVPVHYKRMRRRGYNQSAVLVDAFSALTGVPVGVDALVRVHHKHSQIGRGREERRQNIAGAFAVSTAGRRMVRGRSVLLMDDVLTTGATATECAAALLEAGAQSVLLLTACRA